MLTSGQISAMMQTQGAMFGQNAAYAQQIGGPLNPMNPNAPNFNIYTPAGYQDPFHVPTLQGSPVDQRSMMSQAMRPGYGPGGRSMQWQLPMTQSYGGQPGLQFGGPISAGLSMMGMSDNPFPLAFSQRQWQESAGANFGAQIAGYGTGLAAAGTEFGLGIGSFMLPMAGAAALGGLGTMAARGIGGMAGAGVGRALGMAGGAVGLLDPFSMLLRGAGAGARAGMAIGGGGAAGLGLGLAGGLVGAMPGLALGAGIYGAIDWTADQMRAGVRSQRQVQSLIGRYGGVLQPFGGTGRGGVGFSLEDQGRVGEMFRGMGAEDVTTTSEELMRVMDQMGRRGMLKSMMGGGVRNADEFIKKFKDSMQALKEVARATQSSLEEAVPIFDEIRRSGFYQTTDVARRAINAQTTGMLTGQTAAQVVAGSSAAVGRMAGRFNAGRADIFAAHDITAGGIGVSTMSGIVSQGELMEATGGTGDMGQLANQQVEGALSMFAGPLGMAVMLVIANPDGSVDQGNLRRLLSGDMSVSELQRIGAGKAQSGNYRDFIISKGMQRNLMSRIRNHWVTIQARMTKMLAAEAVRRTPGISQKQAEEFIWTQEMGMPIELFSPTMASQDPRALALTAARRHAADIQTSMSLREREMSEVTPWKAIVRSFEEFGAKIQNVFAGIVISLSAAGRDFSRSVMGLTTTTVNAEDYTAYFGNLGQPLPNITGDAASQALRAVARTSDADVFLSNMRIATGRAQHLPGGITGPLSNLARLASGSISKVKIGGLSWAENILGISQNQMQQDDKSQRAYALLKMLGLLDAPVKNIAEANALGAEAESKIASGDISALRALYEQVKGRNSANGLGKAQLIGGIIFHYAGMISGAGSAQEQLMMQANIIEGVMADLGVAGLERMDISSQAMGDVHSRMMVAAKGPGAAAHTALIGLAKTATGVPTGRYKSGAAQEASRTQAGYIDVTTKLFNNTYGDSTRPVLARTHRKLAELINSFKRRNNGGPLDSKQKERIMTLMAAYMLKSGLREIDQGAYEDMTTFMNNVLFRDSDGLPADIMEAVASMPSEYAAYVTSGGFENFGVENAGRMLDYVNREQIGVLRGTITDEGEREAVTEMLSGFGVGKRELDRASSYRAGGETELEFGASLLGGRRMWGIVSTQLSALSKAKRTISGTSPTEDFLGGLQRLRETYGLGESGRDNTGADLTIKGGSMTVKQLQSWIDTLRNVPSGTRDELKKRAASVARWDPRSGSEERIEGSELRQFLLEAHAIINPRMFGEITEGRGGVMGSVGVERPSDTAVNDIRIEAKGMINIYGGNVRQGPGEGDGDSASLAPQAPGAGTDPVREAGKNGESTRSQVVRQLF